MDRDKSHKILRRLRIELGYTQGEVASWIQADRPNFNKKEKGVVTVTADEFLTIVEEFAIRGPGPKAKKDLPGEINQLLTEKENFAGALLKLCHESDCLPESNSDKFGKETYKMLDRYEKLINNYSHIVDSLQSRVTTLETFITSNSIRTRKGDPKDIKVGGLRRHP